MTSPTRRLAAIMFTDIVGYTALMAESEEKGLGVREKHRALVRPFVERYHGESIEARGDESLSTFSTALDAVNCALAIEAQLQSESDLKLHLGIHLGDIVVLSGEVSGDGVNIASRICSLSEGGGLCVSGEVYQSVRNQPHIEATPLGEHELKNVGRPVAVFTIRGEATAPRRTDRPGAGWRRLRRAVAGAAGVIVLLGGGIWLSWPAPLGLALELAGLSGPPVNPSLPDRPSIVVLPFTNMSDDPEQEYFSDGITEDLTTELAKEPQLFVISRNSAFTYKGRAVNLQDVGRELGVRYVLEGSVRRAENRVRIAVQLIDAISGFHVWSERYDRDLVDVLTLQAEISEEIQARLGVEILEAEVERIRHKPTENLTAYDAFLRGYFRFNQATREDNAEARRLAERAIELDPEFADAYALLGATYSTESANGWSFDPGLMDRAGELAQRVLELNPSSPYGHLLLATVAAAADRPAEAVAAAQRAIEYAPNWSLAHSFLANVYSGQGNYLGALRSLQRAMRLNPRGPSGLRVLMAYVNWNAGREREALELFEQTWAANPSTIMAGIPLVEIYQKDDRRDEARAVAQQLLHASPELTVDRALKLLLGGPERQRRMAERYPERYARVTAALRDAGLP